MGEIADMTIKGRLCAICGVYLDDGETVYAQGSGMKLKIPEDGTDLEFPVECEDCFEFNDDEKEILKT